MQPTISCLSNGIRVVSLHDKNYVNDVRSIGIYFDVPQSNPDSLAPCHVLNQALSQGSSHLGAFPGTLSVQYSRDLISYRATFPREEKPDHALQLMANLWRRASSLTKSDTDAAAPFVSSRIEALRSDPQEVLNDLVHMRMFEGTALGLPLLHTRLEAGRCAELVPRDLDALLATPLAGQDRKWHAPPLKQLSNFVSSTHCPTRCVVVASGIPHDSLLQATKRHLTFATERIPSGSSGDRPCEKPGKFGAIHGHYISMPPDCFLDVDICYPTKGLADPHLVPLLLAEDAIGKASAFSAGGPGKGVLTRANMRSMGMPGVMRARAHMTTYGKQGFFGIHVGGDPAAARVFASVSAAEFMSGALEGFSDIEIRRAKSRLKASFSLAHEQQPYRMEDAARQVFARNLRGSGMETPKGASGSSGFLTVRGLADLIDRCPTQSVGQAMKELTCRCRPIVAWSHPESAFRFPEKGTSTPAPQIHRSNFGGWSDSHKGSPDICEYRPSPRNDRCHLEGPTSI
uniref:Processing peptidase alpha subunit n=1 Tax=Paratrimastix pyriformis TaxID=342808 RepID=B0F471_9EUKA|nr:processing peptidase alpha subunit [Paratrimastix pyriformis]